MARRTKTTSKSCGCIPKKDENERCDNCGESLDGCTYDNFETAIYETEIETDTQL